MATTTTPNLSAGGAAATLPITLPAVNLGTASLPVYLGLTPDGSKPGAFVKATADFVGAWTLVRRTSGVQGDTPVQQIALRGDQTLFYVSGAGPVLNLVATDQLTLNVVSYTSGSVSLAVVQ